MFLTPRKTPLAKKEEKEEAASKAVRTIPAPPKPTAIKLSK